MSVSLFARRNANKNEAVKSRDGRELRFIESQNRMSNYDKSFAK